MRKAVFIGFDTELKVVDLDVKGSYQTLSEAVDGYIEAVYLTETMTMWVNEEGKLDTLPVNGIATAIFQEAFGVLDIIMGNVIITGGHDNEGETLGLGENVLTKLVELFATEEN